MIYTSNEHKVTFHNVTERNKVLLPKQFNYSCVLASNRLLADALYKLAWLRKGVSVANVSAHVVRAHVRAHRGATCDVDPLQICGTKWSRDPEQEETVTFKNRLTFFSSHCRDPLQWEDLSFVSVELLTNYAVTSSTCHFTDQLCKQRRISAVRRHICTADWWTAEILLSTRSYFIQEKNIFSIGRLESIFAVYCRS